MTTRCLDAAVISSISIYHAAKDDLPISPAEAISGNTICLDNNIRGASTGAAKKYGHVGGGNSDTIRGCRKGDCRFCEHRRETVLVVNILDNLVEDTRHVDRFTWPMNE